MIEIKILKNDIISDIFDKGQIWYVSENGFSMIINDCQLLDY